MNRPALAAVGTVGTVAWTLGVVTRMRREYDATDSLRWSTVVLLYSAYAATGGAAAWASYRRSWPLPLPHRPALVAGAGTAAAGVVVAVAGMGRFGSAAQISGVEPGALTRQGVYAHSRNPQYLGLVALLGGVSVASRSGLALALSGFAAAVLDRWVRTEEQHLHRVFGESYDAYAREVSRWWGRAG